MGHHVEWEINTNENNVRSYEHWTHNVGQEIKMKDIHVCSCNSIKHLMGSSRIVFLKGQYSEIFLWFLFINIDKPEPEDEPSGRLYSIRRFFLFSALFASSTRPVVPVGVLSIRPYIHMALIILAFGPSTFFSVGVFFLLGRFVGDRIYNTVYTAVGGS
jgi:hypothetical protein